MQCFLLVYHEYPTRDLIFLCIHTRLKARVYTKKNQVTRGIFYSIPRKSKLLYMSMLHYSIKPQSSSIDDEIISIWIA